MVQFLPAYMVTEDRSIKIIIEWATTSGLVMVESRLEQIIEIWRWRVDRRRSKQRQS